jgi:hypothetical protein
LPDTLGVRLKSVAAGIWWFIEYKSYSMFSIDAGWEFVCYGFNVMKKISGSAAVHQWHMWPFCWLWM